MGKKLADAKVKSVLAEVIIYRDRNLRSDGKRNMRDDIDYHDFKTFLEVMDLLKSGMEVGYIVKSNEKVDPKDIVWGKPGDTIKTDDPKIKYVPFTERHTNLEIEFNDVQLDLIRRLVGNRIGDLSEFKEFNDFNLWLNGDEYSKCGGGM